MCSLTPIGCKPTVRKTPACVLNLGVFLFCLAPALQAAQMTILVRGGATGWQVMQAEKITFNQKEKLREGSGPAGDLKQDSYKSLRQVEIAQAGLLRVHAGGYLVVRV